MSSIFRWNHNDFRRVKIWIVDAFLVLWLVLFGIQYTIEKLEPVLVKAVDVWKRTVDATER